ncbi:DUF3159 domain-containing protein [Rhizomonospora bruguierae]|uniref:DUF3159 domain-containing protein n=1 Tax=Rhizomonospora bruguierae TaxID=1581705 RepID=UPI001BCD61A8|nr:DUF3159 domain-containing protein [Micromonospora sp. NBRC 107566]
MTTPPPHEHAPTDAGAAVEPEDDAEERLPSFAEQMADQLGGWRGLAESSVPVVVFVLANILTSLNPALIASVGVAVAIAVIRLTQRKPIRHAVNGLLGVGIGAYIAWRTGDSRDFYLPGIFYGIGYGLVLLGSAAIRQPLVGWLWSVIAAGGKSEWRGDPRLVRTFTWLTVLWGVVWLLKVGVQAVFWAAHMDTALGVARLLLGYPPYAVLLAITLWVVRRVRREYDPAPAG